MEIRAIFTLALIVAMGTIVMVQQNATNQTGNQTSNSSSIYGSQDAAAKPDQTKFCDVFNNDDGTQGRDCTHKSMGECKKSDRASGQDFAGCEKREKGGENGDGNNRDGDDDPDEPQEPPQ